MTQNRFDSESSLVSDVIRRILPAEKMSEAERLRLEAELQRAIIQADWQRLEKEIEDRISARELAKAELEKGNFGGRSVEKIFTVIKGK